MKVKYPKREYVLMKYGQVIFGSDGTPYRCSKEVAEANVKAIPGMEMLKIGRDIILGRGD